MGKQQSNWYKKEQQPVNRQCQTPGCEGTAEKKYKWPDADQAGFAHFCLDCWRKWVEKELNAS